MCVYNARSCVLTDGPVGRVQTEFFTADDVPDAGEPVREYGERGH